MNKRIGRPRSTGLTAPDKLCRFCRLKRERENQPRGLRLSIPPHNDGRKTRPDPDNTNRHPRGPWDQAVPIVRQEDGRSIPDVTVNKGRATVYIGVTVPFDEPVNLCHAAEDTREKYGDLGIVLPLIVGALGFII